MRRFVLGAIAREGEEGIEGGGRAKIVSTDADPKEVIL